MTEHHDMMSEGFCIDSTTCSPELASSFAMYHGTKVENPNMVVQKLSALYGDQELSDISFHVGHRIFHAHKLVMCMSSDVFKAMLTNPKWTESQKSKIVLTEPAECVKEFVHFLKYMYTGSTLLTHLNVLPLLMLADKYNVFDLASLCIDFMCGHVVALVQMNKSVSWYQYAKVCGHKRLERVCKDFIMWNFHKVMCTSDFVTMELENLIEFLQSSSLVVHDEFSLYRGLSYWLEYQNYNILPKVPLPDKEKGFESYSLAYKNKVMQLMSHVRFPMMTIVQLLAIDADPLPRAFPSYFREKIDNAMQYHFTTAEEQGTMAWISGAHSHFHPRNYIIDTWSTFLEIDSYQEMAQYDVRPILFASPVSNSNVDESKCWEWNVDLYPKGVHFQKGILIGMQETLEIDDTEISTVRLSVSSKTPETRHVEIAILVIGVQDNVEYVRTVVQKRCIFNAENRMFHLNDVVPYDELNCANSPFLSGPYGNTLKITIIIKPL